MRGVPSFNTFIAAKLGYMEKKKDDPGF